MKRRWQKVKMEQHTNSFEKSELRKAIREQKKKLSTLQIEEKSKKIFEKIMELPAFVKAERVYAYVSYNQEVSTFAFLEQVLQSKKVLLVPKVYGDRMKFHVINSLNELSPGAYGIPEPSNDVLDSVNQGFMLLPGLAFDRQGHRLGYGGGYYDKYLCEHNRFVKVAAAYSFQLVEEVKCESQDIPVDIVATEEEVVVCNEKLGE